MQLGGLAGKHRKIHSKVWGEAPAKKRVAAYSNQKSSSCNSFFVDFTKK